MKCFIAKANIQKKIVRNGSEINHLYSIKKLRIISSMHTHAHQIYNSENQKTQQVSHIYFQNISKTIYRMCQEQVPLIMQACFYSISAVAALRHWNS